MEFHIHVDRKGKQPVYLQIRDQLKQQIIRRGLPADTQLPNVEVIADLSKCSLRTADFAMQALVADGVCYRRPKQGTFVSASAAPAIRHICGIWSVLKQEDFSQNVLTSILVQSAIKTAEQTSLYVNLMSDDPEDTIRFYNSISTFDFHGILVVEPENFPRMLTLASEFPHIRFVMLNYHLPMPEDCPKNVFLVVNDDALGSSLLMQYYASLGMRKFAVFSMEILYDDLTYRERVNGFLRTAAENSLLLDPGKDIVVLPLFHSNDIASAGYNAAKKYLEAGNRPDVICAVSDFLASGIRQCVDEMGLSDRIRVSGYDMLIPDIIQKSQFDSVKVDYSAMSRTGIELLQQDAPHLQKILIPPQLHIMK